MRKFVSLFLLLCLPLQALGVFAFDGPSNRYTDIAHTVMHESVQPHHHLDDGRVVVGQSEDSSTHLSDHTVYHGLSCAILATGSEWVAPADAHTQADRFSIDIPDRNPEGLLRPPRQTL